MGFSFKSLLSIVVEFLCRINYSHNKSKTLRNVTTSVCNDLLLCQKMDYIQELSVNLNCVAASCKKYIEKYWREVVALNNGAYRFFI